MRCESPLPCHRIIAPSAVWKPNTRGHCLGRALDAGPVRSRPPGGQGPLVTIVTPSYNQGAFIRATIESVLEQDYPGIEYIVVDGGSTDQTPAVVKDYISRLTWISEPDRGQSHAINKGFQMARGAIVSWLNSDDILLPGAVSTAVRALDSNTDLKAIYANGFLIDREGAIKGPFPHTQPFDLWRLVNLSDYILQQTVFFRKDVFAEVGYLDENLHYVMDWDILIRIGKAYGLGYLPVPLACLREHPEAKSFSGGKRRIQEIRDLLRRHSGRRWPPGYILYALDTYKHLWARNLSVHGLSRFFRLGPHLERLLCYACDLASFYLLRYAQGWFDDGWAAKEAYVMLPPPRDKHLLVRVSLPPRHVNRQRLTVAANGSRLGARSFQHGEFSFYFALPPHLHDQTLHLTLRASRTFWLVRPLTQVRRVAYILKEISLCEVRNLSPDSA